MNFRAVCVTIQQPHSDEYFNLTLKLPQSLIGREAHLCAPQRSRSPVPLKTQKTESTIELITNNDINIYQYLFCKRLFDLNHEQEV